MNAAITPISDSHTWPPNGRCSRSTSTPKIPAATAMPGKTMTIAQSSGCARARSRQSRGSTAPVTAA
jgi:hypothetical protein